MKKSGSHTQLQTLIRSFDHFENQIFLTFDDGPNDHSTSRVLDVLKSRSVPATFFLVGQDVRPQLKLVQRLVSEGHQLGNHSWDHLYANYFSSETRLREWVGRVNQEFRDLQLPESVGFRPPAGVVTPPLVKALASLREPLILWNERFFDAVFQWGRARADRSARRLSGGSIVLLHDGQKAERIEAFCETLDHYITSLRARGFEFAALTREICLTESGF